MLDRRELPYQLAAAKQDLEQKLRYSVGSYEKWTGGPLEFDLTFSQNEGGSFGDAVLWDKVREIVEEFHRAEVVKETGIRVIKVTAFDSDADGQAVVRVNYDYPR